MKILLKFRTLHIMLKIPLLTHQYYNVKMISMILIQLVVGKNIQAPIKKYLTVKVFVANAVLVIF
jgi:hypothetical protein